MVTVMDSHPQVERAKVAATLDVNGAFEFGVLKKNGTAHRAEMIVFHAGGSSCEAGEGGSHPPHN
jgi:hypothetical protein